MPTTAAKNGKKKKGFGSVSPFATITIKDDKKYNPVSILNDGTVHFIVEFPDTKNICRIKLNVNFEQGDGIACEELRGPGGTVVIDS